MTNDPRSLQGAFQATFKAQIEAWLGHSISDQELALKRSPDNQPSDWQSTLCFSLARQRNTSPRQFAQQLSEQLELGDTCSDVSAAGPGFLNFRFHDQALERALDDLSRSETLRLAAVGDSQTLVIDYSSPNAAKELHVGHLRSTVIGDALARVFECLGHTVLRQNHLGDFGTQFGILIEHVLDQSASWDSIKDLTALYQAAKKRDKTDPEFKAAARLRSQLLQSGEPISRACWESLMGISRAHLGAVYEQLGVTLTDSDLAAESSYAQALPGLLEELQECAEVSLSDGAQCLFLEGFENRDGSPLPLILQKQDGAYTYACTDLAALAYRCRELKAERLLYVVDARQRQHFDMVFAAARATGLLPDSVSAEHLGFGTVMNADKKPFKTSEGETEALTDLLDEGIKRAQAAALERRAALAPAEELRRARVVGIGAIKFADLSNHYSKDYVFDWSRMLAMEGQTAPYLQYAYARIASIGRRAQGQGLVAGDVCLSEPAERALGFQLLQFGLVLEQVAEKLEPHLLCQYLFKLASQFSVFYERCPVLSASTEPLVASRLALCQLTARTLERGLGLLGIEVLEAL